MFKRKKSFTAAGTKLTSHRMRSAMLGTHVERRVRPKHRRMNADAVGFSSSRKKRRAARGLVDHMTPDTASRESGREYARRVSRRQYTQKMQHKARTRRIAALVVAGIAAIGVAALVGIGVFVGSVNGKLALSHSNAGEALASQAEGKPYYLLCAANLDAAQDAGKQGGEAYVLVRIDEANKTAAAVAVPSNLQVKLSDGANHPLSDAALSGDAALVGAVADFAGVSISHFARTDAQGIANLVDAVGGVSVDLVEEVDDPAAGDVYLEKGTQALDAKGALTLLRASNYSGGEESQSANRAAFFCALAKRLVEPSGFAFVQHLDDLAANVQTDWNMFDIVSVADAMRGGATCYTAVVPGRASTVGGQDVFVASDDAWRAVMEYVEAGKDPSTIKTDAPGVDPAGFTVAVRNGTSITGAAAQLSKLLGEAGYNVVETGNVDDYTIYPETLVIYKDEAYKAAAAAVVATMEAGRVVNGGSYYTFDADVLVVIGKDYQPIV